MGLRKAASLGAVQTVASMLIGFASIKITSIYLGPTGIGILSQLQNFIAIALGIVVSGMSTGVIRLTAEYGDDGAKRRALIATLLRVLLFVGLPLALIIFFAAPWVAQSLLYNADLASAVRIFGVCYLFGLLGGFLVGLANGAKDYLAVTLINIGNATGGLILFALLCPSYGVPGALAAAGLMPVLSAVLGLVMSRGKRWLPIRPWQGEFSREALGRVSAFIPMAATTAVMMPLLQVLVRDLLAEHTGMASVGLVQGIWRLSDIYLGIITSTLSMYYLPRFAEIKGTRELRHEIARALLIVVPLVVGLSGAIYLLRDLIIQLLFTRKFLPMSDLFGWMMLGNVLKMTSWVFGYVLVARGSPFVVMGAELFYAVCFLVLSQYLVPLFGAEGLVGAYAAAYLAYLCVVVVLSHRVVTRTSDCAPD